MNKTIKILLGVLAVQLLLAGGLYFKSRRSGITSGAESFLRLNADEFDQVVITESEKPPITLTKKEARWTLPDRWDFPVAKEKIVLTLDKLLELKKTWPVGDSAAARKRCKVTEETFEKKVVFNRGGKEKKVLYLGTSPEYRKVHFRPSDRDEIILAEFGYHDLSMTPTDWEDKKFLFIDRNTVLQIETPAVRLVNNEKGFQVDGLAGGETINAVELESLVSQITSLTYTELVGPSAPADAGLDSPSLKITIRTKEGKTVVYDFGKAKTGDDYYLRMSSSPYIFKIAKSTVDVLRSATRAKLIVKK